MWQNLDNIPCLNLLQKQGLLQASFPTPSIPFRKKEFLGGSKSYRVGYAKNTSIGIFKRGSGLERQEKNWISFSHRTVFHLSGFLCISLSQPPANSAVFKKFINCSIQNIAIVLKAMS